MNDYLVFENLKSPLSRKVGEILKSSSPVKLVNGVFLKLLWKSVEFYGVKFYAFTTFEKGETKVVDRVLNAITLEKNTHKEDELTFLKDKVRNEIGEPTSSILLENSKILNWDYPNIFVSFTFLKNKFRIVLELKY